MEEGNYDPARPREIWNTRSRVAWEQRRADKNVKKKTLFFSFRNNFLSWCEFYLKNNKKEKKTLEADWYKNDKSYGHVLFARVVTVTHMG